MWGKLLEILALVALFIHLDIACVDPICHETLIQTMLSMNNTDNVCRMSSDFIDCAKASCNITEFPQEMYDRLETIFSINGLKCDFQQQQAMTTPRFSIADITEYVSSTNSPVLAISTQMTATACVGVEECQAALETAISGTAREKHTQERAICGIFDDFFSCFRSKCGGGKLPYVVLQAMEESIDYLTSSCDFSKHFDIASTLSPVSELSTRMADLSDNLHEPSSAIPPIHTTAEISSSTAARAATDMYQENMDVTHDSRATSPLSSFLTLASALLVAVLQ